MDRFSTPMPSTPPEGSASRYRSRPVDSNQDNIHPRLFTLLHRHLASSFDRPVGTSARRRFELVEKTRLDLNRPVILDSGCGNGLSTRQLAEQYPGHLVIGVDKSKHRLGRGGAHRGFDLDDNCLLVRMDLQDFWLLALERGWKLQRHYLLYPNPWPKARHLGRRWYAHPVFPAMLRLEGQLEFRTNWRLYAEEFTAALAWATGRKAVFEHFDPSSCLGQFEIKYRNSGLTLYRGWLDLENVVPGNQ